MLIPEDDYDDYDPPTTTPVKRSYTSTFDGTPTGDVFHVAVELDCSICKKSHTTHVRGEVPEDGKVPCYTCWAQYYLPVLEEDDAYETPSDEDTEKFPIPRPVASNSYDNFPDFQDWDDLSEEEAYYYFGFGL